MKRSILLLIAVCTTLLGGSFVASAPAGALTRAQCAKYDGRSFRVGSDELAQYQKTNCSKDGFCKGDVANDPKYVDISCKSAGGGGNSGNNGNGGGNNNSASSPVGGIGSTNCINTNKVCVASLPKTANTSEGFVRTVLQIAIGIIAAISVLFVAIGGLRYVLSQGDPQGVGKAKSTIVYALIGLVIAILAQAIVVFVVKIVT